jgi:membrane protein
MTEPKPPSRADRLRARVRAARARWPWFDHLVRAYDRFSEVLGGQLAAAITYFGFLSFFPLLALAFAAVGYISGGYPGAQDAVTRAVQDFFPSLIGSGPGRIDIQDVIDARAGAGIIGLVGLYYSGLGWLDALRDALRRVYGTSDVPLGLVRKKLTDIVVLGGLGLAMLASLVTTSLATAATRQVLGLVNLDDSLVAVALLKVLSVALALVADTVLFAILLSRLSGAHQPWRQVRSAAFVGAVGFEVLKLAGTFLIGRTTHNPVYATFGVVVGLLIWINLISKLLIFVAAFGATQAYSLDPALVGEAGSGRSTGAAAGTEPVSAVAPADFETVPAGGRSPAVVRRRGWRPVVLGGVGGAAAALLLSRRKENR